MSVSSQKKKENIHLVESLNAIKEVNKSLMLQIETKETPTKAVVAEKLETNRKDNKETGEDEIENEIERRYEETPLIAKKQKKDIVCLFYKQNKCRAGSDCEFKHSDDGLNPRKEKIDALCRFGTNCRKKENCKFEHKKENVTCRFKKNCRAGEECLFSHKLKNKQVADNELESHKKQKVANKKEEGSKNELAGMQNQLHSLSKKLELVTKALTGLEERMKEKPRQDEENQERMF